MVRHGITREIGIDAGHRVTHHGSKCRNLHGHRYTIQATCEGPLYEQGEQEGMVLDFGFLKDEMMAVIDAYCDHGMILWQDDPALQAFTPEDVYAGEGSFEEWLSAVKLAILESGYCKINGQWGKLYVVPFVPTAENLAKHWFDRLAPRVTVRTDGTAHLTKIKVWETPNCSAEFPL